MTAITYKQLREDASIRTYIIRADESPCLRSDSRSIRLRMSQW